MELFWIAIAFIAGLVAQSLRLPTIVGYLAAGLALTFFDIPTTNLLVEIGDFGVKLLLFTVGLHIRIKNILRPEVLGTATIHLLAAGLSFSLVLWLIGLQSGGALLVAVALGFSSTVLTAKSLEARGELDAFHGRVAIGILIVQDLVAIILLAFSGTATPTWWALLLLAAPLLRPLLLRVMEWSGREELLILFGLLLTVGAGALFDLVGISDKLGALAAGVLLTGHQRSEELYDKLWGLKEVFLVGFFLQIGLAGFPDGRGLLNMLLLLILLPLKAILFFFLLVGFRLRARTAFLSTLSLTAYSEFALIVATAAAAGGLLPLEWVTVLGLLTAVSFTLNAPLSRSANDLWVRLESTLTRFERETDHPDTDPPTFGRSHYLIVGMGRAGASAYDTLAAAGERQLGLDADPAKIEKNLAAGRRVIFGDAQDPELWHNVSLDEIKGVIMTLPTMSAKIRSAEVLREEQFAEPITALIRQQRDKERLFAAGVTAVSLPMEEAGRELAQQALASPFE